MNFDDFKKRYMKKVYGLCLDAGVPMPKVDENRLFDVYLGLIVMREWDNENSQKIMNERGGTKWAQLGK